MKMRYMLNHVYWFCVYHHQGTALDDNVSINMSFTQKTMRLDETCLSTQYTSTGITVFQVLIFSKTHHIFLCLLMVALNSAQIKVIK